MLLVVLIVAVAAWFGLPWHRDRSYVGTMAAVTLEWRCVGRVVWTDDDRNVSWDSVEVESGKAQLDALEGIVGRYDASQPHRVTGTMRFTNYTDATFVSVTGAELRFVRHPEGQFYTLGCGIG